MTLTLVRVSCNPGLYSSSATSFGTRPRLASGLSRRRHDDVDFTTKQVEKREHLADRFLVVGRVQESVKLAG